VHQRGTLRQLRERLLESLLLLLAAAVVQLGRVEVREHAGRSRALEDLAVPAHSIPAQSGARHSGVDLEMPVAPGASPRLDDGRVAQRGREIGATHRVDLRAEDGSEDDDRARDAAAAQLFTLGDRCHAIAPRSELLERESDVQPSEPVTVGLDHGQERYAGARRDGSPVAAQRGQVHLDPGACHRTARCAIM
jgi:hypothetical protein